MKCMARAGVCDLEFGHDGKCAVVKQSMQYRMLPEPSTAKERRRYALLQAAVVIYHDDTTLSIAEIVTEVEALLAEIERRETPC